MKALAIRESQQLARVVRTHVARVVNEAKAKGIVKLALCGNRYSPVPFSAFKVLRDRLRRRAMWHQIREQLLCMTHGFYILDGKTPVPAPSVEAWGAWFETADRRVRLTRVGPYHVSTVFLGLDHNFSQAGAPILFETNGLLRGRAR